MSDLIANTHLLFNTKYHVDKESVLAGIQYFMAHGIGGFHISANVLRHIVDLEQVPDIWLSIDEPRGTNEEPVKIANAKYYLDKYHHKLTGLDYWINTEWLVYDQQDLIRENIDGFMDRFDGLPINFFVNLQYISNLEGLEHICSTLIPFLPDRGKIVLGNNRQLTPTILALANKFGNHFGIFGDLNEVTVLSANKNKLSPICITLKNIGRFFDMSV